MLWKQARIPKEIEKIIKDKGKEALKKLAWFMENAKSEEIQFKATQEILNRAYGKPVQPLGNETDKPFLVKSI